MDLFTISFTGEYLENLAFHAETLNQEPSEYIEHSIRLGSILLATTMVQIRENGGALLRFRNVLEPEDKPQAVDLVKVFQWAEKPKLKTDHGNDEMFLHYEKEFASELYDVEIDQKTGTTLENIRNETPYKIEDLLTIFTGLYTALKFAHNNCMGVDLVDEHQSLISVIDEKYVDTYSQS